MCRFCARKFQNRKRSEAADSILRIENKHFFRIVQLISSNSSSTPWHCLPAQFEMVSSGEDRSAAGKAPVDDDDCDSDGDGAEEVRDRSQFLIYKSLASRFSKSHRTNDGRNEGSR